MEARFEAQLGTAWPFPDDLCKECRIEWFKSPEGKAKMEPMHRAMEARWKEHVEKWKGEVRARVLKVLDVADAIAGKL